MKKVQRLQKDETESHKLCVKTVKLYHRNAAGCGNSGPSAAATPARTLLWAFLRRGVTAAWAAKGLSVFTHHLPLRDGSPAPQHPLAFSCASIDSKTSWEWKVVALPCRTEASTRSPLAGWSWFAELLPKRVLCILACLHSCLALQVPTMTWCICFLGLLENMTPTWMAKNNTNWLSYSSKGQKFHWSKI